MLIEANVIECTPATFSNIPEEMPGVELELHYTHMESTTAAEEPEPPTIEERATTAAANASFRSWKVEVIEDGRNAEVGEQSNLDLTINVNIKQAHQDEFTEGKEKSDDESVAGQQEQHNSSDNDDNNY